MDLEQREYTMADAIQGMLYLLEPGEYGLSDEDPKISVVRDAGRLAHEVGVWPVIIGGLAVILNGHSRQTVDVDLLIARDEALRYIRRLEQGPEFTKLRIDRFRHITTGIGLDLFIEGELTAPGRVDRFPPPKNLDQIPRDPLPVVSLMSLILLKAESSRMQDCADFVALYNKRGLTRRTMEEILAILKDPKLKAELERWYLRAEEERDRERLLGPPQLE